MKVSKPINGSMISIPTFVIESRGQLNSVFHKFKIKLVEKNAAIHKVMLYSMLCAVR